MRTYKLTNTCPALWVSALLLAGCQSFLGGDSKSTSAKLKGDGNTEVRPVEPGPGPGNTPSAECVAARERLNAVLGASGDNGPDFAAAREAVAAACR